METNDINVLLLSRYSRNGASSRIRTLQYIPYLLERGVSVHNSPLLPESYLHGIYRNESKINYRNIVTYIKRMQNLLNLVQYDVIWMEKEAYPWMPAWVEYLFGPRGLPYIVDYDDATFHRYDLNANPMVRKLLGRKIDKVMRRSAVVIAGNDYLAERARAAHSKYVKIIPSVVDLTKYAIQKKINTNRDFHIGWIGSPATATYVQEILPFFASVLEKSNVKLVLVGSGVEIAERYNIVVREWTENTEVDEINRFDVGVMPLNNGPWEQGKCGYKLIQYMACGKPVIASPVGMNKAIVKHGWNGYLANTKEEWQWAINTILANPQMAKEMGANGRKLVEEKYSVQINVDKLADIFRDVVRRNYKQD
jgi:glycosyltransferase involved in cell wall biosynthesis